ncbi:hypothetical protein Y032_0210g2159 [Ancylostoma ceylanicum]|uniref:Endonuclease/exonuclease/phosphatase domain-containing protein n=1 Tax=Ancylostoma ceylanicum TaxID=53326 RepID=A0A016SLD5_9BILA|nr:hypothetical protein Y032_0210g2159 [Ancylostoma ceylanicum]
MGPKACMVILVPEKFRDAITELQCYYDPLMKIMIVSGSVNIQFFSTYAPQSGLSDEVKEAFWTLLDKQTTATPNKDVVTVVSDLNGHVGIGRIGSWSHGDFGFGERFCTPALNVPYSSRGP